MSLTSDQAVEVLRDIDNRGGRIDITCPECGLSPWLHADGCALDGDPVLESLYLRARGVAAIWGRPAGGLYANDIRAPYGPDPYVFGPQQPERSEVTG